MTKVGQSVQVHPVAVGENSRRSTALPRISCGTWDWRPGLSSGVPVRQAQGRLCGTKLGRRLSRRVQPVPTHNEPSNVARTNGELTVMTMASLAAGAGGSSGLKQASHSKDQAQVFRLFP
jgi:hypothetical protein